MHGCVDHTDICGQAMLDVILIHKVGQHKFKHAVTYLSMELPTNAPHSH